MKKFISFSFMAAVLLSMTSCCCDRDPCCDPCPPRPRCCEPRPCCPKPVCCPPRSEPKYYDNDCCY
ncbi:MAG: hypothetical protein LW832_05795 [Parachlamydia sp.]|nr:hypothetical protein [Parachlamydia sp.]